MSRKRTKATVSFMVSLLLKVHAPLLCSDTKMISFFVVRLFKTKLIEISHTVHAFQADFVIGSLSPPRHTLHDCCFVEQSVTAG